MRKLLHFLAILTLFSFTLLLWTLPAAAQEFSAQQQAIDPTITLSVWQAVTGVVLAVLSGGALTIAGVGVLVERVRKDNETMTAIERLGDSVPRELAEKMLDFSGALRSISAMMQETFDGVPVTQKQTAQQMDQEIYGKPTPPVGDVLKDTSQDAPTDSPTGEK
jgi:hypothetical protein